MSSIKLKSSEGEVFEVDATTIAKCSVTIKTMLEDLGTEEGADEVIPLPNVCSTVLEKVVEWATFHYHKLQDVLPSSEEEKRTTDICAWDANFLKVDQGMLFELMLAANYLDMQCLLHVACKTVANMIKGKTPEEIRKTFNIKNVVSKDQEEQSDEADHWSEEAGENEV